MSRVETVAATRDVLGIETSCDETAVAVVRRDDAGTQVLSSVIHRRSMQHKAYGGVVPEIAARAHVETIDDLAAAGAGRGRLIRRLIWWRPRPGPAWSAG